MPHTVLGRAPRNAVEAWFWAPITVLRVSLISVYALYVYAAWIAFRAGIPIFSLLTPPGYTSIWAVLLGIAAIICFITSLQAKWEKIERWAALGLFAMMAAYCVGLNLQGYTEGDLDRQFVGVVSVIAIILPLGRFLYLAAQSGKKPADAPLHTGIPPIDDNAAR